MKRMCQWLKRLIGWIAFGVAVVNLIGYGAAFGMTLVQRTAVSMMSSSLMSFAAIFLSAACLLLWYDWKDA